MTLLELIESWRPPCRAHQHDDGSWFFHECHPHNITLWIDDDGVRHVEFDAGSDVGVRLPGVRTAASLT